MEIPVVLYILFCVAGAVAIGVFGPILLKGKDSLRPALIFILGLFLSLATFLFVLASGG